MDTIFQLDNELMVELSEDAQELVQGGSISYDLDQQFFTEAFALKAVNGPGGSAVAVTGYSLSVEQSLHLFI